MSKAPRAWLIDASIYIFRAWFSMPDRWTTDDGMPVQAVYGYTRFLLDLIERCGPSFHSAAAFDESLGTNFRNSIYPQYKASRVLPDEALAFQLDACRRVTQLLGWRCYGCGHYEADDYLASLARVADAKGLPVTVITRDKDLGQILRGPQDHWWDFAQDKRLDAVAFEARFGVRPDQFADYLALVGDSIDDIPGVPGVGAKTAAALLQAYGDLAGIEAHLDCVETLGIRGAARVQERLAEHWPQVAIARQLTGLADDIEAVAEVPRFDLRASAIDETVQYLESLNLGGPLVRRARKLEQVVA